MGSVRREVRIDAPPDEVWALLGSPERLHEWFPGLTGCDVDGSTRTIHMLSGISLPEEILLNDDLIRRFQYTITAGLFRKHLGTIDVFDLGDGTSLASYATDAEPDVLALVIGGAAGDGLQAAKQQIENAKEHR